MEKKESLKGERAVKPVILLPSEKCVLKIGFLKIQNWYEIHKSKNLKSRVEFGISKIQC